MSPTEVTWPDLRDTLLDAAKTSYPAKQQKPRKDYITPATWALIQQRQHLANILPPNAETLQQLRKQIKKAARADMDQYMANKVHEDLDLRDRWFGVKMLKKQFSPQVYTKYDKDGTPVAFKQQAEATTDYLDTKHWAACFIIFEFFECAF